jgi:predicted RNA methylase
LGQDSLDQDATGLGIWAAALVTMVEEAVSSDNNNKNNMLDRFENRTVIELGAGCGVPGMVVAASVSSSSDNDPNTVTSARQPPSKVYLTERELC